MAATSTEFELKDPPTDGITNAVFAHFSNSLLVSSWDQQVRLYDTTTDTIRHSYGHGAAVLDCCFSNDDTKAFSGGVDGRVMKCDLATGGLSVLGSHDKAVKCVTYSDANGPTLYSGSWDSSVKTWDTRQQKPTACLSLSGKVYAMSNTDTRLVVGTSGRHVYIYDVRALHQPEQVRESSLMNQTRCIRAFPDNTGYALSSIEGRVAIEYFAADEAVQANKYAFKCHRKTVGKTQVLYPVNALAFNPVWETMASGGCDNLINIWDTRNKKRICQYPSYPTSIASLSFNFDGTQLAIASSYTFEEGEKDHPRDSISIRQILETEVKPKAKTK